MTLTSSYLEKFTDFLNLFASAPNIATNTEEVSKVVDIPEKILMDARFQSELSKIFYTNIIKYNRDRDRIVHARPLEGDKSRNDILDALANLGAVDKKSIIFTGYNNDHATFLQILAHQVTPLMYLLDAKLHRDSYSLETLRALSDEAQASASFHDSMLHKIPNLSKKEFDLHRTAYVSGFSDKEAQISDTSTKKSLKSNDLIKTLSEINEQLLAEPELFWETKWNEHSNLWSMKLWRNYQVSYDSSKPQIARWEDSLGEHTTRDGRTYASGIVENDPQHSKLTIQYTSSYAHNNEGALRVYVEPRHYPKTIAVLKNLDSNKKALEKEIADFEEKLQKLQKEAMEVPSDLQELIIKARNRFESLKRDKIDKAIVLYQEVDRVFNICEPLIACICEMEAKISVNGFNMESTKQLLDKYSQILDKRKSKREKPTGVVDADLQENQKHLWGAWGNDLSDPTSKILVPLLDPVVLRCSQASCAGHLNTYEHRCIAENTFVRCPVCKLQVLGFDHSYSELADRIDSSLFVRVEMKMNNFEAATLKAKSLEGLQKLIEEIKIAPIDENVSRTDLIKALLNHKAKTPDSYLFGISSSFLEAYKDFPPLSPKITKHGYSYSPDLSKCSRDDLRVTKHFVVECQAYGKVEWMGEVDVCGLDLDDIVTFVGHAELDVKAHPLFDHRLNRPAIVTLYNLHVDSSRAAEMCLSKNGELIEYDAEFGSLTYRVERFY